MTISSRPYNIYEGLTSVRVATTANISGTYSNGPSQNGVGATLTTASATLTVDTILLNSGDRVLLHNQTAAAQNGIYTVTFANNLVVLVRAQDFQNIEQMKTGQMVSVAAGSAGAGDIYVLVEPKPAHLGVDALTFTQS